jgi:hypothetical protein
VVTVYKENVVNYFFDYHSRRAQTIIFKLQPSFHSL